MVMHVFMLLGDSLMQAHTEVTSPITPSMHTMYTTHTCVTPYTLYSTACHPMHMLVMHNMAKQEVTPDHPAQLWPVTDAGVSFYA